MRNVVVHYHRFKNAGTSVDAWLSAQFGAGWQSFDRPTGWSNITTSDLLAFLRERPAVQALSSHQARWPEPRSHSGHFAQAVRRINDLPAFGLVEQFDASLAMLTASLADAFPELVLQPHRDNTSGDRTAPLEQRVSDIGEALGGDLYRRLVELNEADLDLYSQASALFAEL